MLIDYTGNLAGRAFPVGLILHRLMSAGVDAAVFFSLSQRLAHNLEGATQKCLACFWSQPSPLH